ncbi:GTPase [Undibacterium luofuense]|uniref:GTPase n=1 Tax=Undibacterium luofuense TaxID=2828733 RepID=UPI0030EEBF5C
MQAVSPVPVTIVTGADYAAREQAIATAIASFPDSAHAVLLEGLPQGNASLHPSAQIALQRIAPGCICCAGQLTLKVSLNRLLRPRPARLWLAMASSAHYDSLCELLKNAPYSEILLADQHISL